MNQKIKIIHIIGQLAFGGAEKLVLDLCRKIDREKFSVAVISIGQPGKLISEFDKAGVKVFSVEKKFKGDWRVLNKIKNILREENPQVVHTHLFGGDYWGGRAALVCHVPVIVSTKHDIMNEGLLKNFLVNRIRRRFSRIIAISQASENRLVKKDKIKKEKVSVIYNGIDMGKFWVEDPKIFEKNEIVFGSIGRLVPIKGHSRLIRAVQFLKRENWHLEILGDGPERGRLQGLIEQLDLQDKISLPGQIVDVREYLADFDVFVLPSLTEGLSLAVIEAAAAGKFIIASNVGGVPEIISDGQTGLLYNSNDIGELAEKIIWVFDHQDEARAMARRLHQEVVQKFDINQIIKHYENLYLTLLKHYEGLID